MIDNTKHLEAGWKKRSEEAKEKALRAIEKIKLRKGSVNFNSVHVESGLSKNYLYTNKSGNHRRKGCGTGKDRSLPQKI